MKKTILLISIFFFALRLFAQEPLVKFYLRDGTYKTYNIADIDNIAIDNKTDNCVMKIYKKDSQTAEFSSKSIDKILFEMNTSNILVLSIYLANSPNQFILYEIDSISFVVIPILHITSMTPTGGQVGNEITINGTCFGSAQGTSVVSFNGTNASGYSSWSATEIKVKVPAGATTGKLSVTVSGQKSNELDFTVIPFITSLNPTSAKIGDQITITGNGFGSTREVSVVSFTGGIASEYTSWSSTSIVVKVPAGAETGKLSVTASGQKSNEVDFTVIPVISSINPTPARIGDETTITGTGFGSTRSSSIVTFHGANASEYISWSSTSIVVKVPAGAETGKLSVTASGQKSNEVDFTVIPVISSIDPTSARIGDEITITGTGFGSTRGPSIVSFTGASASEFTSWSATTIVVKVSAGAETGKLSVTASGQKSNEVDFTVFPFISSINPTSAKIGDQITITGNGFGSTREVSVVSFTGANASEFLSWSTTSIVIKIPTGAETGKLSVTISGQKSNEVDFTLVNAPNISGINPNSAEIGANITITGTYFGSTRGTSIVSFTGADATEYTWSATSIVVKVPTGAITGNVSVTVSGNKSNEITFTVYPFISGINPSSAQIGADVTITGTNFGSTRGTSIVSFTGADATEYTSWNTTSIVVKVPTGASSGNVSVTVGGNKSNERTFTVETASNPDEVTIGTQVWMLKNLDLTTYRNGDAIPQVTDGTEWANLTTGAWCYSNNDANNGTTYGKLYNWFAVNDSRGLAPSGWHVASDAEWTTLSTYLGGESVAGGKQKETGTTYWLSPNTGATNESGFSALPGGFRFSDGSFNNIGINGDCWSSTEYSTTNAWIRDLGYNYARVNRGPYGKVYGISVRCVRD